MARQSIPKLLGKQALRTQARRTISDSVGTGILGGLLNLAVREAIKYAETKQSLRPTIRPAVRN